MGTTELSEQDNIDISHLATALKPMHVIESLKKHNFNQHPFISKEMLESLASNNAMQKLEELVKILFLTAKQNLSDIEQSNVINNDKLLRLYKTTIKHYIHKVEKAGFNILELKLTKKADLPLMLKMLFA